MEKNETRKVILDWRNRCDAVMTEIVNGNYGHVNSSITNAIDDIRNEMTTYLDKMAYQDNPDTVGSSTESIRPNPFGNGGANAERRSD